MVVLAKDLKESVLQYAMQGKIIGKEWSEESTPEIYKHIREVTARDKKFKSVDNNKQKKVIKYFYYLADDLKKLECKQGEVYLLSTGQYSGYTTIDKVKDTFSEGEVVAIPWGGSPNVRYYKGKFVTSDNRIATSLDENILNNKFLYYFMLSQTDYLDTIYRGTSLRHPDMSAVLEMNIPIPSIEDQKLIVKKLDEIILKINEYEELERESEHLNSGIVESIRYAILQSAIEGKLVEQNYNNESANCLLKKISEEKEKLIKEKKLKKEKKLEIITDEEKPYDIPSNWERVRLGEIFNVTMGQSPEGTSIGEKIEGMEFHQGKISFTDKIIKDSGIRTNQIIKVAYPNSILLCMRAPVGKVNITDREICIGRGLSSLSPFTGVSLEYSFYVLQILESEFIKKSTGSTFKAITGDIVKNQIFPLPPQEEQERIVGKIDSLMKICDELENQIK